MWNFLFCGQSLGLGGEDQGAEPAPCGFCRVGGKQGAATATVTNTRPLQLPSFCTCLCNQGTSVKVFFFISWPFFSQFKMPPLRSWHSAGGSRQLKGKWSIIFSTRIQCTPSADATASVCGCSQLTLFKGWLNNSLNGWSHTKIVGLICLFFFFFFKLDLSFAIAKSVSK